MHQDKVEPLASATAGRGRKYRYYDFAMAATCVIVVCSNIIGASKVGTLAGFEFGAGVLFFPLSYVLGDVMTEVYGYGCARRVVWASFAAAAFAAAMAAVVTAVPPAAEWNVQVGGLPRQEVFAMNFAQAPRIVAASVAALWLGEFANAFVLARMKVLTKGRMLWTRTIGSTVVGQAVDSLVFYPLAFIGVWPWKLVLTVMVGNYALKVVWEAALTPLTYAVVGWLKRAEGVEVFDTDTNFTPFSLKT